MIFVAPAAAWDQLGATWPAFPVTWYAAADLGDDVDDAEALAAIQAGFDAWEAVDCAAVDFDYGGRVEDASFGEVDGRNVVFLLEDSWPDEASLVSAPAISSTGSTMEEVDLALNGVSWRWAVEGADGTSRMDVQAAVTHEVGHLLGLWHSSVSGASLDPSMDGNPEARSLEEDDISGLCTLYGAGDAGQGESCTDASDCQAELVCLADGGERYCAATCDDGSCPEGFDCLDAPDGTAVCARSAGEGCGCGGEGPPSWALGLALLALRRR